MTRRILWHSYIKPFIMDVLFLFWLVVYGLVALAIVAMVIIGIAWLSGVPFILDGSNPRYGQM